MTHKTHERGSFFVRVGILSRDRELVKKGDEIVKRNRRVWIILLFVLVGAGIVYFAMTLFGDGEDSVKPPLPTVRYRQKWNNRRTVGRPAIKRHAPNMDYRKRTIFN